MTLAPCPNCGTQTMPGLACAHCGTPTPAPVAQTSPASPFGQWDAILHKLQRVAGSKYVVKNVLGVGGMAGVYLAEEPRLGRKVAIKVMAPAFLADPGLIERFVQEARTIAQLSHPNIVTIYEVDDREDLYWFAMTYVGGRTLGQVMAESTELMPITVVRAWLYQIGDALGYAHQHGIVHRDIKPGNVLLDLRGNALVTDFGIAKVADAEAGLTRTGMLVGTPAYMSPEQCSSGQITGASDQYALGAVAYQMLTGQPPFSGATLSVLHAHVAQEPTPLLDLRADCPEELANAIAGMLQKQPEDRWPSLSAAVAAAGATPPGLDGHIREQLELLAAPAAGISVSPWSSSNREGAYQPLQVLVVDAAGRILRSRRVDWTSSNPNVAAVSEMHRFGAFAPGHTQIIASCGTATVILPVTVSTDPLRALRLEQENVSVQAGNTVTLDAVALDLDGTRLDDRAVLWTSADPAIARVSTEGRVEGLLPGQTTISAHSGGHSAHTIVTVNRPPTTAPTAPGTRAGLPSARAVTAARAAGSRVGSRPSLASPGAPAVRTAGAYTSARPKWPRALLAGGIIVAALGGTLFALRPWQTDPPPASAPQTNAAAPAGSTAQPLTPTDTTAVLTAAANTQPRDTSAQQPTVETPSTPQRASRPSPQPLTTPVSVAEATLEILGALPEQARITVTDAFNRVRPVNGRSIKLDPGTYAVDFNAPGHEPDERTFSLRAGERQSWTPTVKAVVPPPQTPQRPETPTTQPARDPGADQAAIASEINGFVAAFSRRDANTVLPLLLDEDRVVWRQMLGSRDVTNFRAVVTGVEPARIDGTSATVTFSMALSYRNLNISEDNRLNWIGRFDKTAAGWRLVLARQVR